MQKWNTRLLPCKILSCCKVLIKHNGPPCINSHFFHHPTQGSPLVFIFIDKQVYFWSPNILSVVDKFVMLRIFSGPPRRTWGPSRRTWENTAQVLLGGPKKSLDTHQCRHIYCEITNGLHTYTLISCRKYQLKYHSSSNTSLESSCWSWRDVTFIHRYFLDFPKYFTKINWVTYSRYQW